MIESSTGTGGRVLLVGRGYLTGTSPAQTASRGRDRARFAAAVMTPHVDGSRVPGEEVDPAMCSPQQPPSCVAGALAAVTAGLAFLANADVASLGTAAQAEALAALERAEAVATAARARILAAFTASEGYAADGQFGPKPWLQHLTRVTRGAASGAVGWSRRLQAHPAVADALAGGEVSASWAREICGWSDRLPGDKRADA